MIKNFLGGKIFTFFFLIIFLFNIFLFGYVEYYNFKYEGYNYEVLNDSSSIELCSNFYEPLGGFNLYINIFSISFILIEISVFLLFVLLLSYFFKSKYISCNSYQIILSLSLIFLSGILLFGSWTGVDVAFYNYIKMYC